MASRSAPLPRQNPGDITGTGVAPQGAAGTGPDLTTPLEVIGGVLFPPLGVAEVGADVFGSVSGAINSVGDFLSFVAWFFHPRNILRIVEFIVGMILLGFGLWAVMQARGESREGFETGEIALSRSGLGRVSKALSRGNRRPESAPHRTRRDALRQRYAREQRVRRREQSK